MLWKNHKIANAALGSSTDGSDSALSVTDFNTIRKRVAQAINAIHKKWKELLDITPPTWQ